MIDPKDGFRFKFIEHTYHTNYCTMQDELEEFEDIEIPKKLALVLSEILASQHWMKLDKEKKTAPLIDLLEVVKEYPEIDKDIVVACINNYEKRSD